MAGWFRDLYGFEEGGSFEKTRGMFRMEGYELVCPTSLFQRQYVGPFDTPSVAELRKKVSSTLTSSAGHLHFRHLATPTGIEPIILNPANAGAVFQAASQFNCLEMVGPGVTPRRGIANYANDPTQGPKCALACPAGTVFRNYLCNDGVGQGERQIDTLSDVGVVVGNVGNRFWTMKNGYALPTTASSIAELAAVLRSNPDMVAAAEDALRVGVHWDTQVKPPHTHRVLQVYASAVPVSYSGTSASHWEPFARLVLRAAYYATLAVACLKASEEPGRRVSVYLTSLGGGAFGNRQGWIRDALVGALDAFDGAMLDVFLVHYGTRVPSDWQADVPDRR
ncbi:hypothetical protein AB1Y20_001065 [Prymnesium parvum]|uniref:Poly(ADP-ribose) glycohydrolase n=1 Tax=Prymnesium parvum TaxID=97485 RepID=A0AB34K8G2_PRYPA